MCVNKPRALFIGRWQPFHLGHEWLVRQQLDRGKPVLIAVRDCPRSYDNPWSAEEVKSQIEQKFFDDDVQVIIIPDIESVNIGRSVGYEFHLWCPPPEIEKISATEIRKDSSRSIS